MEAHRNRRTKDPARKHWYAYYRQVRFARWFGLIQDEADLKQALQRVSSPALAEPVVQAE